MIVITTIFWIIVGIIALCLTIFVVAFIYNTYLLTSGKMTKDELNDKVQLNKEKRRIEKINKKRMEKAKAKNRNLGSEAREAIIPGIND